MQLYWVIIKSVLNLAHLITEPQGDG
jgi:hypothetical protein